MVRRRQRHLLIAQPLLTTQRLRYSIVTGFTAHRDSIRRQQLPELDRLSEAN
ncbi:uncharacterized protein METZ01_LOCUS17350 [marine metagenome]|uniref:Uncharacterized protein n=1 Tax=marine metagenome TaxID=408172 RepID=A0A381PBZ4_9ZZZZ